MSDDALFSIFNDPILKVTRKGSAVHVLAQPTPLGDGPTGFLYVTDDKITTTFKVSPARMFKRTFIDSGYLDQICIQYRPSTSLWYNQVVRSILLPKDFPGQMVQH